MLNFIILSLAVWRATSLIVQEEGPFDVFVKMRYLLGVRYNEKSELYGLNFVAEMLLCVWCASVWVALFFAILYFIFGDAVVYASTPFALSAAAIVIDRFTSGE